MRLVITGILALIILILICAVGKKPTESHRTKSIPPVQNKVMMYPHSIQTYSFDWKKSFFFPKTNEKTFYFSLHRK